MAYKQGSLINLANLTDNAVVRGDGGTAGVQTSAVLISDAGQMTNTSQPNFLAYLASTASNKTGTGTTYQLGTDALTEVYDQGSNFNTNGTFTAPITGKYLLSSQIYVTGCTIATTFSYTLATSNRSVSSILIFTAGAGDQTMAASLVIDMDTNDTATTSIAVTGEAANTDDLLGGAGLLNFFAGVLIC